MQLRGRWCALSLLWAACGAAGNGVELNDGGDPMLADGGTLEAPEQVRSTLARVGEPSAANLPALAVGNAAFAFDMLRKLGASNPGADVVFSPYSVSSALGMTYAGARGETQRAMKTALRFELEQPALHEAFNAVDRALAMRGQGELGADRAPFRLQVGNALWQQRGLPVESAFLDTLAVHYGAGVFVLEFASAPEAARMTINDWVAQRTEQLIPELLPADAITAGTTFVLTNTVYFNASWKTPFDKARTSDAPFQRADGASVQVPMMNAGLTSDVAYAAGDGYEAVALPYASEELAFVAVLPADGGYDSLEADASAAWFSMLQAQLAPSSVQLSLPKLDVKTAVSLRPSLRELGMARAFEQADFSGITPGGVAIDDLIHEARVRVFEEGTLAAAATAVVSAGSIPTFEHEVRFDRPFLYAIVDRPTGQILFLGRVLDPSAE